MQSAVAAFALRPGSRFSSCSPALTFVALLGLLAALHVRSPANNAVVPSAGSGLESKILAIFDSVFSASPPVELSLLHSATV